MINPKPSLLPLSRNFPVLAFASGLTPLPLEPLRKSSMDDLKGGEIPHLAPALPSSFIAARISPIFVPLGVALLCEEGLLSSNKRGRGLPGRSELKFSVHHYHQSFPFKNVAGPQLFARSSLIRCRLEKYDPSFGPLGSSSVA